MKRLTQNIKWLLILTILFLLSWAALKISQGVLVNFLPSDTSVNDMSHERWRRYEEAMLEACYSTVSLPAEKLCEWDVITQHDNTVYVWAFCIDSDGRGFSGPRTIRINSSGDIEATCPRVFDDYKTLFPDDLFEQILNYQSRFDLDRAWHHIELRFQDRTIPPLIVVDGTPLP